jgi:hypothetical protein
MGPIWGPATKTNWPTDCRSQRNLKLNSRHCTANYRPVLSSEKAPYMKNKESNCHWNKYNIWSLALKGARHQDELSDWPSVVMWLRWVEQSLVSEERACWVAYRECSCWELVTRELLWLRRGDISQRKVNVSRWKLLSIYSWRHSWLGRVSACRSELQCVWNTHSAEVHFTYEV